MSGKFYIPSSNVRYWVGGSGNWSDIGHWSTSSGGANSADVPTINDSVYFDSNSGFGSGGTVYFNSDVVHYIKTISIAGTAGNLIKLTSPTNTVWTISCASGTLYCPYLDISYSTATGGALFYTGSNSVDNGNNTGWIFTDVVTDSFGIANKNHEDTIYYATVPSSAQSFTGKNLILTACEFYIKLGTTPPSVGTQFCRAMLFTHAGVFGVSSVGVGNPWGFPSGFVNYLAISAELDMSTIPSADFGLVKFTFNTPYTLVDGTNYVIVFENDGVIPVVIGCYLNNSGVHGTFPSAGNRTYFNFSGNWFTVPTVANCFNVYGKPI